MIILLTGLPGSGKSTVARILAEKTQGIVINSDDLRRVLFPVHRTYSSAETGIVIREKERLVKKYLAENKTVILDALFTKQNARDEYKNLAKNIQTEFKIIHVIAPEQLIKERLATRSQAHDSSEATFETYLERKKYFEAVEGDHLVIDNSGDLKELSKKVMDLIFIFKSV